LYKEEVMTALATDVRAIRNGWVVTPGGVIRGGVAVEGETIAAVASDAYLPTGDGVFDAAGCWILPGVVDPDGHLGTSNDSSLDLDFESESRAAVGMGTTTWGCGETAHAIFAREEGRADPDALLTFSGLVERFQAIGEQHSSCDFFLTPMMDAIEQVEEIADLAERWGITGIELLMHMSLGRERIAAVTPTARSAAYRAFDDELVYLAMRGVARLGGAGLLAMHCENWQIAMRIGEELREAGRTDMGAWHDRSPGYLETMHVKAYGYLAAQLGTRFHIMPATAPETFEEIKRLRSAGADITAQTGAHYLVLDERRAKVNVPLRPASYREPLWNALRSGTVSSIGSDHAARRVPREAIDTGNVWTSVSGFPSRVEAQLPILLTYGVADGRLSIARLVRLMAENPARLWGVYPRKGVIAPGADADFVVVDPNKRVTLTSEAVLSVSGWSVFEGSEFRGWPVATFVRGRQVAEWSSDRCSVSTDFRGQYLARPVTSQDWQRNIA
jgi:dihydroorotase-like cyclic amidohydrolase